MEKTWTPGVKWKGDGPKMYRQKNPKMPVCPCAKCGWKPCGGCTEFRQWVAGSLQIIRRLFGLPLEGRIRR